MLVRAIGSDLGFGLVDCRPARTLWGMHMARHFKTSDNAPMAPSNKDVDWGAARAAQTSAPADEPVTGPVAEPAGDSMTDPAVDLDVPVLEPDGWRPERGTRTSTATQTFGLDSQRGGKSRSQHRHHHHGSARRRRRTGLVVVLVILAAVLVAGGIFGYTLVGQAREAKALAKDAMAQADTASAALEDGDSEGLGTAVSTMASDVDQVYSTTHNGLCEAAPARPVVGPDVRSAQTLAEVASDLVHDALEPVAKDAAGVKLGELVQDGRVNVEAIQALSGSVEAATPVVERAAQTVEGLPEPVTPQLKSVMDKVRGPISSAGQLLGEVGPAIKLLPQMLGADGTTRHYLVIAQNNSELRATGGLPGAWVELTVTDGEISMDDAITILHRPGLEVQALDEELSAIATHLELDPAQVNCTANFVRVGQMSAEYWDQVGGGDVDGVIAIDPVFLGRLLALTGPITGPDGAQITGDNCAQVLLSDVYWKFGDDGDAQDEYFAAVAAAAFQGVMDNLGSADVKALLDTFSKSVSEGRVIAWMRDTGEEDLMATLGMDGAVGSDPAKPVLGVYLNDDTISKICWYTGVSTNVGAGVANGDGTTTYDVTTTITNGMTTEEAAKAPQYISGSKSSKTSAGDMVTYFFLYGPAGGTVTDVAVDDESVLEGAVTNTMYGLDVVRIHLHTGPAATTTVTYKVTCAAGAAPLALRTTPLAQEALMVNSAPGGVA